MRPLHLTFIASIWLCSASAVHAQDDGNWKICIERTDWQKPGTPACDAVIEAGKITGLRLAQVYYSKGFQEHVMSLLNQKDPKTWAQAFADVNMSISIAPTPEACALRGGMYYWDKNWRKTADDFERAQKLDPKSGPEIELGPSYEHLGLIQKAQAAYDDRIAHNRKDPASYVARGDFYRRNKKPALAVVDYTRALELQTKRDSNAANAAVIEYRLGLAEIAKAKSVYALAEPSDSY